ncbi:GON-4-like protein isoform X2 [Ceratina calcarata]|nr:GON-4-like protein isoform X2 [Ceratina calcarata]
MEEEIERQLDAKAAKTNLTATNVKNILKHVITNEHVMAMVQNRLQDAKDDVPFEPKLTRAKAKELAAAQVNIPWPITPIKKPSSEVQALIEEELSEDSSDEEYDPNQDKQSDDEREVESSVNSDIDSEPSTPVNHCDSSAVEQIKTSDVQYDAEGIFKIPGIPHVPTEEESIGQRTRSKLCLSETPLEQIEQAFVPPDITTDMYDWDCEVDEDWDNFLKEFTQPLTQEPIIEDDPEADPEYNILDDEETEFLDKEELRADKAVKVTRKELNNLIAELFEFAETFSQQEQEISKKRKSTENTSLLTEDNIMDYCAVELPPSKEPDLPNVINQDQRELLAVQFRQHVQLMAQHFVMTYMLPNLHDLSQICKQNLNSIKNLNTGPNSAFNVANLADALQLVSNWENKLLNKFSEDFKQDSSDENVIKAVYHTSKHGYIPKFHPDITELFMESKALVYPQLLPWVPFKLNSYGLKRIPYLKSEEALIAIGLEQFHPFLASKPRKLKSKKYLLMDTAHLIAQYLLPCRKPDGIYMHIQKRRFAKSDNPIKHYFEKGSVPRTIHYITLESCFKAPKEQPTNLLPLVWQSYRNNTEQRIDVLKRKKILNSINNDHMKTDSCINENRNSVACAEKIAPKNALENNSAINEKSTFVLPKNTSSNKINDESYNSGTLSKNHASHRDDFQRDKIEKKIDEKLNEVQDLSRNSIIDHSLLLKKSSKVMQKLPRLRSTIPRLAKTRSAQNMKLMVQVLGPKSLISNCNTLKSKEKNDLDKNLEKISLPKIDNEDEIAELMLASTTIKKDSISRKKAKEAKELENVKRLLESENPLNEEEKCSKFAASYLQKLHLTLESNNPETFRSVIKSFVDYYEKLESIDRTESELMFSDVSRISENEKIMQRTVKDKDAITIDLYRDVCDKLHDYPGLCTDFLLFLKPHQAAIIDQSVEYIMLQKIRDFINVAQIYFAKQPSRIAKIMQAIAQLASDPQTTLENVYATMSPILKSHPLVMDLFLQTLPNAKPPESIFAPHMFENLTCPVGPYDKSKVYPEDAPELYENIELPISASQEDPYGGENCRCYCHNSDDISNKTISEHCASCGARFLNGKIYLQTSEGLRPAKIIFPGADEEKLENISRVSLKTVDKFVPSVLNKSQRKSTKNECHTDEHCQKLLTSKNSPTKENEEGEKLIIKSKKTVPKSKDQKKSLKRRAGNGVDHDVDTYAKKMRILQCKKKKEKKDNKTTKIDWNIDQIKLGESSSINVINPAQETIENITSNIETDNITDDGNEKTVCSGEIKNIHNLHIDISNKPWTRQEDMILLQAIKKEYSEKSLIIVSRTIDRTVDQVKERCEMLLTLLQKMV